MTAPVDVVMLDALDVPRLQLAGITEYGITRPAEVSSRAVADGTPQGDGVQRGPARISLRGTIPTEATDGTVATGEDRVAQVDATLQALQSGAVRLSVYLVGTAALADMVVGTYSIDRRGSDPELTLALQELRTPSSRTVTLAPLAAPTGPPAPSVLPGLSPPVDQGPTGTVPLQTTADATLSVLIGT